MNTQDLIDQALTTTVEPMRSRLGQTCDWITFAEHGDVEVMMSIWGQWFKPAKTRATFFNGYNRISRATAEDLLANNED